ncbi:hypothetical protein NUW58_g3493 [Xylaria curta]|uniref:Uncharacterized protein n=1 Tax=Xylaria curta TaxID=42375 RepID=A0ACC1PCE8_9PEZI|nr:hypothetical protein NUW58_g3493 [Xylaria curta]
MPDFTGLQLTGKVAIVTGASRERKLTEKQWHRGWNCRSPRKASADVVVNHVSASSRERAEKVAKEIEANGTKAIVCQADVSKLDEIPKLVEAALKISTTGKIDILIHKYVPWDLSLLGYPSPLTMSHSVGKWNTALIKWGPIFLTKAVEPHLPKGGCHRLHLIVQAPVSASLASTDFDEVMLRALDAGAEDVEKDDDGNFVLWTQPNMTHQVAQDLAGALRWNILSSDILWSCTSDKVKIDDPEEVSVLAKLLSVVQEYPDVQAVYINAERGDVSAEAWSAVEEALDS